MEHIAVLAILGLQSMDNRELPIYFSLPYFISTVFCILQSPTFAYLLLSIPKYFISFFVLLQMKLFSYIHFWAIHCWNAEIQWIFVHGSCILQPCWICLLVLIVFELILKDFLYTRIHNLQIVSLLPFQSGCPEFLFLA